VSRSAANTPLLLLVALAIGGCKPCPEKLLSLDELIGRYNANADAVPRLWARAEMSVSLAAPGAAAFTWRSGSPTCLLLLKKGREKLGLAPAELLALPRPLRVLLKKRAKKLGPHDFVLIGRETAAVELFRIGSSTEQGVYYFWYRLGDRGGAWFGRHAGTDAPGVRQLPIDPMQLLGVLAICALPEDPTRLPAVAVGMQNTPGDCAYVVTLIDRQPVTGRLLLKREVYFRWSETEPPRPYKVNLIDSAGRRIMTAHLKSYTPIDCSELDDPPDSDPVMPSEIEIVCNPFPGVETFVRRIRLKLSEMTAEDKWDRDACDFQPPAGIRAVSVDSPARPRAGKPPAGGEEP
jgi:hypothetical protein